MEAIVNYGSEDEQDESNGQSGADCGGGSSNRSRSAVSTGRGRSHSPFPNANNDASGSGTMGRKSTGNNFGRNNYSKEEESQKYRASTANRSGHYDRDNNNRSEKDDRHHRDRDSRSFRESKDCKMNERNRSKDYKEEQRRDNGSYRGNKRATPRDDAHNRHFFSSISHHKDRYYSNSREERSRHSDSSVRHNQHNQYHQRGRDERDDRGGCERSNHYERSERSRPRLNPRTRNSRSRSGTPRTNSRERERHGQQELQHQLTQPLEQARQSALEMERKLKVTVEENDESNSDAPEVPPARRIEALLSLPLNDNAPKQPSLIAVAPPCSITSAYASAASMSNNAEPAVIQLPSYYNPSIINPNKYAEQVQKRKLLWGAKKNEDTTAKWGNAQFSQDTDGKVASKFMRLMGIKGATAPKAESGSDGDNNGPIAAPDVKSREAMFSSMEQQYEVARQATHTMRGVGLGFSSQARPF